MNKPSILYHWTFAKNVPSINANGLRIKMRCRDDQWNAPYLCFSDCPEFGWSLTGSLWYSSGKVTEETAHWALFAVQTADLHKFTRRKDHRGSPAEWRVPHDIPPDYLVLVTYRSLCLPNQFRDFTKMVGDDDDIRRAGTYVSQDELDRMRFSEQPRRQGQ